MILHFVEIGPAMSDDDLVRVRSMIAKVPQRNNIEIVIEAVHDCARSAADSGARPPWCGYLCILPDNEAAGTCRFTSEPANRVVEITFATFPIHEGRGVATEMVRQLAGFAQASGLVSNLIAYTPAKIDVSTSVLMRNGFTREFSETDNHRGFRWIRRVNEMKP